MKEVSKINTGALRKDISALIKQINENVSYRYTSDKISYPYIIYKIKDIYNSKVLEIDAWDYGKDTSSLESIMDRLEEMLSGETVVNDNHGLILYYNEDRVWVEDEDKRILHIHETYEIRYYGKE